MNNQSQNNGNKNSNNKKNSNSQMILMFLVITLVALFFMSMFSKWQSQMTTKEISYTEFLKMVEEDKVKEVRVTSNSYRITPKGAENELVSIAYFTGIAGNDLELVSLLKEHGVEYYPYIPDDSATWIYNILSFVLPLVLLWVVMAFLMKRMGGGMGMGVGKSNAKVYVEKKTGVTFKDVAGQDEAKESLQEVVDFLHNPQKYTDIGAKLPKGALLVGPPGTGKTLLAKAVAGEANVPFFSLAGSDFVEMFVGVGASRVRDLFKEAQKQAPCIIFIDEIDAIGKSRDTRYGSGNDEREQTLNQLLAEMDGFDTSKGILILAATNRPEVLDKALLRPGRFDRRIIVEKPDLKGRVETLKVHSKDVLMDETVDLDAIALATSGAVGSDLANMINEAAINAVKNGRKYVNQADLFESVEVVIAGKEKKDRILGKEEKKIVAYHEVGHALVTALQKNAEPVQKITIVPRTMGALGYVMQVPEEEKYLMSEEELKARLVTFMAGRAAEEIVFHSITTGASNDIEKATQVARAMVTQYGMSKKFGLISLESVENRYLDGRPVLNCGDNTAAEIDTEVQKLLKESYEKAYSLLEANRDVLDKIADYLFEHETITGKEFMRIYRELKGIPEPPEENPQAAGQHAAGVTQAPKQPVVFPQGMPAASNAGGQLPQNANGSPMPQAPQNANGSPMPQAPQNPNGSQVPGTPDGTRGSMDPNGNPMPWVPHNNQATQYPNGNPMPWAPNSNQAPRDPNGGPMPWALNGNQGAMNPNRSRNPQAPNGNQTPTNPNGSQAPQNPNRNQMPQDPNGVRGPQMPGSEGGYAALTPYGGQPPRMQNPNGGESVSMPSLNGSQPTSVPGPNGSQQVSVPGPNGSQQVSVPGPNGSQQVSVPDQDENRKPQQFNPNDSTNSGQPRQPTWEQQLWGQNERKEDDRK